MPFALGAGAFWVSVISASMSTSVSGSLGASLVVVWAGEGEDMMVGEKGGDGGGGTGSCRTMGETGDVNFGVVQ